MSLFFGINRIRIANPRQKYIFFTTLSNKSCFCRYFWTFWFKTGHFRQKSAINLHRSFFCCNFASGIGFIGTRSARRSKTTARATRYVFWVNGSSRVGVFFQVPGRPGAQDTRCPGYQVPRMPGAQETRRPGYRETGIPGCQVPRIPGYQETRIPGYRVTRCPGAQETR